MTKSVCDSCDCRYERPAHRLVDMCDFCLSRGRCALCNEPAVDRTGTTLRCANCRAEDIATIARSWAVKEAA